MKRAGFTLVEVMVALVVIGVVVVGARTVLGQVADSADRIAAAASEADRDANADRLLRAVVGRLELVPGTGPESRFEGEPNGARFRSWCEVPDGWLERCDVALGFVTVQGDAVLGLRLAGADPLVIRRGFRSGELLYLRDGGGGGDWVARWGASITAPLAIGVVVDGDTTIVRIGERG